MKRSSDRILTTHCGSLPRPRELIAPLHAKDAGDAYDRAGAGGARAQIGGRGGAAGRSTPGSTWSTTASTRSRASPPTPVRASAGLSGPTSRPPISPGRRGTRSAFPGVYEEMKVMYGARTAASGKPRGMVGLVCTGPIKYIGHAEVTGRHRQSQGCARRQASGRGVHHRDLADQSGNVFSQPFLPFGRGVSASRSPTP